MGEAMTSQRILWLNVGPLELPSNAQKHVSASKQAPRKPF